MRRLITIPISHFCEKARWARERAGLEYAEERHVQGVHRIASKRAGGVGTVPVLVTEGAVPAWEDRALRRLWGPATRWVARELGIGPETIREDGARVERAFDAIAARLADGRPHLCGERFTAADLTFACLAAPVIAPPGYGTPLPRPDELPAPLLREFARFRAHPAGAYALRLYESRRAGSSAWVA